MNLLLCGMGNIERGDDGFGPYIIHNLRSLKQIKTIDCGMHIENYLNKIVSEDPDLIVLLDTIEQCPPKGVLLRNEEIMHNQALSVTTHALPFSAMYDYLKAQGRSQIWLFGVKPLSYEAFSDSVKILAHEVIQAAKFLDIQDKINIINVYETLSSTLR